MTSLFIQPVASLLINAISGKGVRRAEKEQEDGFLPLLALPLMMKSITARGYNGSYGWKSLVLLHLLTNMKDQVFQLQA